MSQKARTEIRAKIADKVVEANSAQEAAELIAPMVEFKTNNERWFQSYVTIGSLGTVVTAVGQLISAISNGDYSGETIGPPITVILTAGFALYGRWAAKRPIGA